MPWSRAEYGEHQKTHKAIKHTESTDETNLNLTERKSLQTI